MMNILYAITGGLTMLVVVMGLGLASLTKENRILKRILHDMFDELSQAGLGAKLGKIAKGEKERLQ